MMMGTGFGGMFLSWGVWLALLASGAVLVSRLVTGTRVPVHNAQPTAGRILDERLTRGEITRQEHDLMLSRIEQ